MLRKIIAVIVAVAVMCVMLPGGDAGRGLPLISAERSIGTENTGTKNTGTENTGTKTGTENTGTAFTVTGTIAAEAAVREETDMDLTGLQAYTLGEVTLLDEYLVNAYEKEVEYLLKLDTDRLLAGFRDTAGLDMKGAKRYDGWENSLIGGHTLGHYVTACVQAYETANATQEQRAALLEVTAEIAQSLRECQEAIGTGFIFGSTILDRSNIEKQFDNVEKNATNITSQAWVPWYTMHKIFEGLVAMAQMTAQCEADAEAVEQINSTALETASQLADWVYGRTSSWSEGTHKIVLSIEYGGMNDCLYDVYLMTGRSEHLAAAQAFDQDSLFKKVAGAEVGDDVLNDLHANTTIPKFMGALKRYTVTGETEYLEYAQKFWDLVVADHTYITGGNSEWEHFGKDDVLDAERTNANCETCNSYNMLKLTKLLFEITGDVKYADWYENTFINSILSSQNPETGMTTYFQPMASGYFKVYGEETGKFWCCTGTGMENFTKLGESFYFHKDGMVVVNQYFSSKLTGSDVAFTQETDIPNQDTARFTFDADYSGKICFRLPDWLAGDAVITVDGVPYDYAVTGGTAEDSAAGSGMDGTAEDSDLNGTAEDNAARNGYAVVEGSFAAGSTIEITLPMQVVAYGLPDSSQAYAFKYGPVVLSALLGTEDMTTSTTGVDVTIPKTQVLSEEYLSEGSEFVVLDEGLTVEEFMSSINEYMLRDESDDGLSFTLSGVSGSLKYVTHYSQYSERYALYLKFTDLESLNAAREEAAARRNEWLSENRLDTVQPGYGQYENDELHAMTEEGTGSTGSTDGTTSRYANAGGSFTYRMLADPEGTKLSLTLNRRDIGKSFCMKVNGTVLVDGILTENGIVPVEGAAASAAGSGTDADGAVGSAADGAAGSAAGSGSASGGSASHGGRARTNSATNDEWTKKESQLFSLTTEKTDELELLVNIPAEVLAAAQDITVSKETVKSIDVTFAAGESDAAAVYGFIYTISCQTAATAAGEVVYFVDCGDHDPMTVSEGDELGTHNSVTEQLYGVDYGTGYCWGLIDDTADQYNGASISSGIYTANTWCYEQNALTDGLKRTLTNRYTKNQYESDIARHIDYSFELEDGEYEVTLMFSNPWSCSSEPSVYAYIGTDREQQLGWAVDTGTPYTANVTVSGGRLDLNLRSRDKAINVCYIIIKTLAQIGNPADEVTGADAANGSGAVDASGTDAATGNGTGDASGADAATGNSAGDASGVDAATGNDAGDASGTADRRAGAVAAGIIAACAVAAGIAVFLVRRKKS